MKARFKALREKYRREVALEEKLQRSGAPASVRPVWPLLSFFKFMNSCGREEERSTSSNIPEERENQEEDFDIRNAASGSHGGEVVEEIFLEFGDNPMNDDTMESMGSSSEQPQKTNTKKRKLETVTKEGQIDDVLLNISSAIKNINEGKESNDRYVNFGKYLASELKSMGEPNASILMEDLQLSLINFKKSLRDSANIVVDNSLL